jgi:hypothetical protein
MPWALYRLAVNLLQCMSPLAASANITMRSADV